MSETSVEDGQASGNDLPFPPIPIGRTSCDLDQFWFDWEPVVYRCARSKLRIARVPRAIADAHDAVQSVYVEVRQRWFLDHFDDKDPGRWALGTALRDFVREQVDELKKRAGNLPADEGGELGAPEPTPEDHAIDQEVARYLREGLQQLPDLQRRAVELTVEGELTREEIAAELGVKVGTISPHRARGLRRLAEILGPVLFAIAHIIDAVTRPHPGFVDYVFLAVYGLLGSVIVAAIVVEIGRYMTKRRKTVTEIVQDFLRHVMKRRD